jgi:cell division protein FtsA
VIALGGDIITEDIKEGCSIIKDQAEMLKIRFGSALASESSDNEIVSIPGLRGREPKEISLKNLANIIQARMEDIIEHVYYEIKNSGFEKKLIAGIVVTGGGAKLKHVPQLIEYMTGMDTRVGLPNEHLAKGIDEIASPMYATAVGLVIKGFESSDLTKVRTDQSASTDPLKAKVQRSTTGGGFFSSFFEKTKNFFEDDNNRNS